LLGGNQTLLKTAELQFRNSKPLRDRCPRHPRGNKVDQESLLGGRRAPRVRFRHRLTRLLHAARITGGSQDGKEPPDLPEWRARAPFLKIATAAFSGS
jgi:hypothetical protein